MPWCKETRREDSSTQPLLMMLSSFYRITELMRGLQLVAIKMVLLGGLAQLLSEIVDLAASTTLIEADVTG